MVLFMIQAKEVQTNSSYTYIIPIRIVPILSLRSARSIETPVNTDNRSLPDPIVLLSYKVNLALSAHCIQVKCTKET